MKRTIDQMRARIAAAFKTPQNEMPTFVTGATPVDVIKPTVQSIVSSRGWKRRGNKLLGAYRTRRGGFAGEIVLSGGDAGDQPSFYVIDPPLTVFSSTHSACYRDRSNGRYWIHFHRQPASIDAGIMTIEAHLADYQVAAYKKGLDW